MLDWLDSVAGPNYASAVLWTFAALLLLVLVLIVIKLIRNLSSGTYVAGGRNRKTRLAVMDATAVDSHRRLVLVRRDDIEHLLLIGGSTDIVVERDIRLSAPRRPVQTGETGQAHPATAIPQAQPSGQRPRPTQPAPAPVTRQPPAPAVAPSRELAARAASAVRPPPNSYSPQPNQPPQSVDDQIDDTLLHELEVSLEDPDGKASKPLPSLDDEMTRLLGELGTQKR